MAQEFDWNDLRFFIAVARGGSAASAGRLLRVDHNTVRRHVGRLETDLRARLFDRRGEGLTLTGEGERLFRIAERMEGMAERIDEDIAGSDTEVSGTVRLGVADGLGTMVIAPLMAALRRLHSSLTIELVLAPHAFDLDRREADLAITVDRPVRGHLVIRKLVDVVMRLYASRAYLDSTMPIRQPEDLAGHVFLSGLEGLDFGPDINALIEAGSLGPRLICSSSVAQLKAAAAGGGLCALARFMAETEPQLIPVLPDAIAIKRELWLTQHAETRHLRRCQIVARFITEAIEDKHEAFC